MQRTSTRPQEVALPAAALVALRRTLTAEVGADAAARALEEAGCAAGRALHPALLPDGGDAPELPLADLVDRLDRLMASRGWGRLRHVDAHPGAGELVADAWMEADPSGDAARPTCFFTTGLLAGLLSGVAGAEVSVLEVGCRSAGSQRCRFLFGAPDTLSAVHERMAEGRDADAALAALG